MTTIDFNIGQERLFNRMERSLAEVARNTASIAEAINQQGVAFRSGELVHIADAINGVASELRKQGFVIYPEKKEEE